MSDLLSEDPEWNARLKQLEARYRPVDERWDAEQGFFVLRTIGAHYIGVLPLMYTAAVIYGITANRHSYLDRWCYHSVREAIAAGDAWSGDWPETEPAGWHRHPASGRRRANGDPSTEEIRP